MLKVNTTLVAVVAGAGRDPLEDVRAANVRVLHAERDAPDLDRAHAVLEQARRTKVPYLLHDADPLAWVAHTWAARFGGEGTVGDLEVATAETLGRWRARYVDLPDYYLLVDPDELSPLQRHWYLGVVGPAAPARVVTLGPSIALVDQLAELRTGPWWPDLDRLLAGLDEVVPDLAGTFAAAPGPAVLVTP